MEHFVGRSFDFVAGGERAREREREREIKMAKDLEISDLPLERRSSKVLPKTMYPLLPEMSVPFEQSISHYCSAWVVDRIDGAKRI